VDVTDAYRGITGTQLPYNFVREVVVRSGAYEAEYQSSLGGIVNVVTYSGGNELHGQVFGFYTNNRFTGSPGMGVGQPPEGDLAQYDFGVSLGGPIIRDKLWFFAAYSPQVQTENVQVIGQSDQTDHSTTHTFASKLSWTPDESNLVTLSIFGDPTARRGVGVWNMSGQMYPGRVLDLNSWLSDIRMGSTSIALSGTHSLSTDLLLESSLSLVTRKDEYNPVGYSGPYQYIDVADSVYQYAYAGTYQQSYEKTTTVQAAVRATLSLDRHTLKAGLEYIDAAYQSEDVWHWLIRLPGDAYLVQLRDFAGSVSTRNPSIFVQDSWRISDRFTLNGGIRWDPQFMYTSDNTLAQKILGTVAPRLGIIILPGMIGSEQWTASAGRFYQPLSLNLTSKYHLLGVESSDTFYPQDPRVDTSGAIAGYGTSYYGDVSNLKGQYYDEITIGYEREVASRLKAGARLVFRQLGEAIEDGYSSSAGRNVYGNPGTSPLDAYPKASRVYKALEVTLERYDPAGFTFQVSYVLSRNYGNYEGLANATYYSYSVGLERWPNTGLAFSTPSMMANSTGLLPDDRTHALKFFCSYPTSFGLTLGASGYWTSGTPLSELGSSAAPEMMPVFLQPRGSVGRSPAIWDLNFRFVYEFSRTMLAGFRPRLILDVLHALSQNEPVVIDQQHYLGADENGNQIAPNPNYQLPLRYQPPMSVRLGMEVDF